MFKSGANDAGSSHGRRHGAVWGQYVPKRARPAQCAAGDEQCDAGDEQYDARDESLQSLRPGDAVWRPNAAPGPAAAPGACPGPGLKWLDWCAELGIEYVQYV